MLRDVLTQQELESIEQECKRFKVKAPEEGIAAAKVVAAEGAVLASEGMLYNLLVNTKDDRETKQRKIQKELKMVESNSGTFGQDIQKTIHPGLMDAAVRALLKS